jgi:magnesium-transporting ATPase (P-type)
MLNDEKKLYKPYILELEPYADLESYNKQLIEDMLHQEVSNATKFKQMAQSVWNQIKKYSQIAFWVLMSFIFNFFSTQVVIYIFEIILAISFLVVVEASPGVLPILVWVLISFLFDVK